MSDELHLDEKMKKVNQDMRNLLRGKNKHMNNIIDWLLLEKGKQLRPKFMLVSADYFDREKDVTEYAAILELFHMATLVHDDVIDRSEMRRGRSSIQKKFGLKAAVYLGDYMLFSIMKNTKLSYEEQWRDFFESVQKLCDGELGQEDRLYDLSITRQEYLTNIEGKTAALFELATYAGAALSGASAEWCEKFALLGRTYGMLFQICDDLLDMCSQKNTIGKPVFQDFYNGIYTMPIIASMEQGVDVHLFERLTEQCEREGMSKKVQMDLMSLIKEGKGMEQTSKVAGEYYQQSIAVIDHIDKVATKVFFEEKIEEIYQSIINMCNSFA